MAHVLHPGQHTILSVRVGYLRVFTETPHGSAASLRHPFMCTAVPHAVLRATHCLVYRARGARLPLSISRTVGKKTARNELCTRTQCHNFMWCGTS